MKTKKRILSLFLAVLLIVTIVPGTVFAEEPAGGGSADNNYEEFISAMNDPAVSNVVVDFDLVLEGFQVFHKNVEITGTGSLKLQDFSILILDGCTLNLNGDSEIGGGARLVNRATIINSNNSTMTNNGIIMNIFPASFTNNGAVTNNGELWMVDMLVGGEDNAGNQLSAWGGNAPSPAVFLRIADVSSADALIYAMGSETYSEIWFSDLGDTQNEGEWIGVDITIPEDALTDNTFHVTKPLNIFKNDSLTVNGNLVIDAGGSGYLAPNLFLEGMLNVKGDFVNNGDDLFIEGTLDIDGSGTNSGYYTLTPYGNILIGFDRDKGFSLLTGEENAYTRGYYVIDQYEWNDAVADSAHCYCIVVGPESLEGTPIIVEIYGEKDIELTCNLIVEGLLQIPETCSLTLNRRYDFNRNPYDVGNRISGEIENQGTLNLNVWVNVCGALDNQGTINMAKYDGDDQGQNWSTDGYIYLYTEQGEAGGGSDDRSGSLENDGTINNLNTISINDNAQLINYRNGVVNNYGDIMTSDGLTDGNYIAVGNYGLIYGNRVNLDYTHLGFQWLENHGDGFYEPVEIHTDTCFVEQPGRITDVLFMLYDYNESTKEWVYTPILPSDLVIKEPDDPEKPVLGISGIPEAEVSGNADQTINKDKYAAVEFLNWGESVISFNNGGGKYDPVYQMPVSVKLPDLGFYSVPSAVPGDMQNNHIKTFGGFSYIPNSLEDSRSFYVIANIDGQMIEEGWTVTPQVLNGTEYVDITPTYNEGEPPTGDKRVFKATVKDGVYGSFPFHMDLTIKNGDRVVWWAERFMMIDEAETEGLVFSWTADWEDGQNGDYHFKYPVLNPNDIYYNSKGNMGVGGATWALFYRHQGENNEWIYEPVTASNLSIVENDSGIMIEDWNDPEAGDIPGGDPNHAPYKFIQLDLPKFGDWTIRYTVGEGAGAQTFDLPITVRLPDVAYYKAPEATEENYIDRFSYTAGDRIFYMIAKPDFAIGEGWDSTYEIFDGADKVTIEATDAIGVYKVTVKDGIFGDLRLHAKIILENVEERWESDRDILINEAETEGLVFSWPDEEWGEYLSGDHRFNYPILKEGYKVWTKAEVTLGNSTLAAFYRYLDGNEWKYTPISSAELSVEGGSGIYPGDWADPVNIPEGITIEDPRYSDYKFAQIYFSKLGNYEIKYIKDKGKPEEKTYTLPVNVSLPEVGFYTDSSTAEQNMQESYIEYFDYTLTSRTFYAIINVPDGFSINWWSCDDNRVSINRADNIFTINVNEGVSDEFDLNFRVEFQNNIDANVKFEADKRVHLYEGEYDCIVYRDLDWDDGHFENPLREYRNRLDVPPQEHAGIFYLKKYDEAANDGAGDWTLTPLDIQLDDENLTISPLEEGRISTDLAKDTSNKAYYRSLRFKTMASYYLNYTEGENTYSIPVKVDLPALGAYSSTNVGRETWLAEVDFTQYREVFLISYSVDMNEADMSKSEFRVSGQQLSYNEDTDTFSGDAVTIKPYREGGAGANDGLIKHFTVTILSTPFAPDFNLEYRIRDGNGNEIAYNELNFFGRINKAEEILNGGSITITEGTPGTVYFSDLGRNAAKYFAFTAADLTGGKAYAFSLEGYTAGGGVKSNGAMLYLFDENWKLIAESSWEDLSHEERAAAIGNSELVKDKTYYIAVYNGHNEAVNCGFALTGAIVDIPQAPVVTSVADEGIGVSGVMVSGAVAGQKYEIYSLVGDEWRHRGTRDFDNNMQGDEYAFFNAFDLVMDGETVTQFAAAISKNGVEGPWKILTSPIPITRADSNSSQPLNVEVLHYPESSDLMVTASNGVFANGVYYRLRHERPDGFWDFHGSFIGNGTNTVFCGCDGELTYSNTDGRYIVAAYSEGSDDVEFRLGWTYAVNVKKNGQTTDGIGSFDYDRPTKWLVIGEENFDQNNRGQRLLGHSLSDGRTKFRLVTYDGDAAGDKYTFSQPLNVSDGLTASAGLTLTDMTGDEVGFVKFSFAEMGEYTVSYTDGAGTYKVILSANSPAPSDVFDYTFDRENGKADINIDIQSLRGREGETVHAFFALYEGGRLVGLATRNPVLGLNGFNDGNVTVNFDKAANPDNCKAFVLNEGSFAPLINTIIKIVPAPLLTKIETSMDGSEIWLTFNKDMADPVGKHNQFTVYVNSAVRTVTSASLKVGDSKSIVLTLASSLVGSEDIKIAYTPGDVAAADGGLLGAIIPEGMMTMQEGDPAFTAGVVEGKAHVGTELTAGPGTLTVQTNLTYIWFRSDDQSFDPQSDVQLGTTGTKYTPVAADKGKYIIVHVSTPDAAGDKYAVIQVE